ncbi:MAG: HPP family protein [Nitrospirae bacterium]|nr:HPP family protein [Nitrospirota bacterium]
MIKEYISKMKGGAQCPPGVASSEVLWSWIGAATGVGLCGYLSSKYFEPGALTLLIGSIGASAVLVFAAIKSPLAQPRNLIGGHIIAAFIGVACYKLFGDTQWLAGTLAVSIAIAAMLLTKTLHPPAGATALIAVIGGKKIQDLGFLYPLVPAGLGALILLIVALIINNLSKNRRYPEYWF